MDLYTKTALACSKVTTHNYSTSFSLGIRLFKKKYRNPIYAIYGFVRFGDEIVDTFHEQDQKALLKVFREETHCAIRSRFSSNPILHSFQWVVNEYQIDHELIDAFLKSMEMDLYKNTYTPDELKEYIYGSAEVVGLMCLRIFYKDQDEAYQNLIHPARKLGEAFQKINFLRDIRDDFENKGRIYFPDTDFESFKTHRKQEIEDDIARDFDEAHAGVVLLHKDVRQGIYLAYRYYKELLRLIRKTPAEDILRQRYRIGRRKKMRLLVKVYLRNKFDRIKK